MEETNRDYIEIKKNDDISSINYLTKIIYIIKLQRVRDFISYFLPQNKSLISYRYRHIIQ